MTRSACLTLGTALLVISMANQAAQPLAEYRWESRILLLYAPSAEDPTVATFRERLQSRQCAINDRDLVVGEILADGASTLGGEPLAGTAAEALRKRHDMANEAVATVLIGKDGGTKMRTAGVADLDAVFARIDGMPMRRREMRENDGTPC